MEHYASCLAIEDKKILCVKTDNIWTLPNVKIEKDNEDTLIVLKTKELTGIDVKIIQLFGIYGIEEDSKYKEYCVFEVESISTNEPINNSAWVSIDEQNFSPLIKQILQEL